MFPAPQSMTYVERPFDSQSSPELRRMDMYNRARREELDAMVYGMTPRTGYGVRTSSRDAARGTTFGSKVVDSIRHGIANALISAGHRIGTTA